TPEGVRVLATLASELPGKGGDAHRRLQGMIKEQAELLGWRATIEERLAKNGGQADVGLEKEDLAVAAEISITTDSDHEISNIQKCLAGGYDYVVWVCPEEARLQSVKSKGRRVFSLEER